MKIVHIFPLFTPASKSKDFIKYLTNIRIPDEISIMTVERRVVHYVCDPTYFNIDRPK